MSKSNNSSEAKGRIIWGLDEAHVNYKQASSYKNPSLLSKVMRALF